MPPPDSSTDPKQQASSSSRPQTVTEVLCRELGARHPDGALQQIRTMKRVLRAHYRTQQRLKRYGIDGLEDVVSHVADLTDELDTLRQRERERAQARRDAIDQLLRTVEQTQQRVRRLQSTSASSPPDSGEAGRPGIRDEEGDPARQETVHELLGALDDAIQELRLELWTHEPSSVDETAPAGALLTELRDTLSDALPASSANAASRENTAEREAERLRAVVDQQQSRIDELEAALSAQQTD